jgi:nitrous oxide reductase accessory protein NosL
MPAGLTRRTLLGLTAAALLLAGCGEDYAADIEAVKQAETAPGTANAKLVDELAGARGKVTWEGGKAPAQYQDNPAIVAVTATIERTTRLGEKRRIDLQFIHNRQTKQVALEGMLVDGKPQDLLAGALNLMLLQLQ